VPRCYTTIRELREALAEFEEYDQVLIHAQYRRGDFELVITRVTSQAYGPRVVLEAEQR
jgi:hypothetical protein